MTRSFGDISWKVTEEEYRADNALSYSTLARYERTGFNGLSSLFDKVETPSLTFGSAVDSIITGGQQEFDERFMVADFPAVKPSIVPIVRAVFNASSDIHDSLEKVPNEFIIAVANEHQFQPNWKPETRAKVIKEQAAEYYKLLYLAKDKTILDTDTYNDVVNTVDALKTSEATKFYFQDDVPFDNIERLYQLKFKATFDGVDYRCMADLIVVWHDHKIIMPVDLKTSSKPEWDFYKSFIEWKYPIQARLYWRIIRDNMMRDPVFRDYKLLDYQFIVANRATLTPLVWRYEDTQKEGTLYYGKNKQIEVRDPFDIGKELHTYLSTESKMPMGIVDNDYNVLEEWLNKL